MKFAVYVLAVAVCVGAQRLPVVPVCNDEFGLHKIGDVWYHPAQCVRYECEVQPGTLKTTRIVNKCFENKPNDRCFVVPGKKAPFPACCSQLTCINTQVMREIVQPQAMRPL